MIFHWSLRDIKSPLVARTLLTNDDFTFKYTRNKRYPDAVYVDDLALLGNVSAEAKLLLNSLGQVARSISLYVNANKTNLMCFKQGVAISSFNGRPLNLVNQFTHLSSNISSTESDLNISLGKAATYIYIYIYIYIFIYLFIYLFTNPPLRQDMTQGQFLSGV